MNQARAILLRRMSEAQLTRTVIQTARTYGWIVAHFRPGMDRRGQWKTAVQGDGVGFPDLILAHPSGDILFVELKSEKGKLSLEQERWRDVLGERFRLVRPSDLDAFCVRLMAHHTGPRPGTAASVAFA
jgi:hypothetical protein